VRKLELLQEEFEALDRRLLKAEELRTAKEDMLRESQVSHSLTTTLLPTEHMVHMYTCTTLGRTCCASRRCLNRVRLSEPNPCPLSDPDPALVH